MNEQHVLPVADLIAHEETEDCPCGPKVTFVTGGKVVTHNSLDGREFGEGKCRYCRRTVEPEGAEGLCVACLALADQEDERINRPGDTPTPEQEEK